MPLLARLPLARALELDTLNDAARLDLAELNIESGILDEARRLLDAVLRKLGS